MARLKKTYEERIYELEKKEQESIEAAKKGAFHAGCCAPAGTTQRIVNYGGANGQRCVTGIYS